MALAAFFLATLLIVSWRIVAAQKGFDKPGVGRAKEWGSSKSVEDEFSTFSESDIRVVANNRLVASTKSAGGFHSDNIVVNITNAFGKKYSLKMTKNRNLFSSTYIEKRVSKDGETIGNSSDVRDHCYYIGTVNDDASSVAAMSTCNGVLGYFEHGKEAYDIEPVDGTVQGRHRVYRSSDSLAPIQYCGHDDGKTDGPTPRPRPPRFPRSFRKNRGLNWPQDLDGKLRVVEFYVVNDYTEYVAMGKNFQTVVTRTKNIVNIASALYRSLKIYLVIVGIEVWTSGSLIAVNPGDSATTMKTFCDYRKTKINPLYPNDCAQLITTITYSGGVIGLAPTGTMCMYDTSCGIITDRQVLPSEAGTIMAHEMGHNFGFSHDNQLAGCTCDDPTGACIMRSYIGSPPQTHWSKCSKDQLVLSFDQQIDRCLFNVPPTLFDNSSVCGNGIVESGEECDCNNELGSQCNQSCCDPITCRLKAPATCASGRCCDISKCQLKPRASVCRDASGPCDLSEYCSGVDALCPSDVYRQDGTACTDTTATAAYCYKAVCRSHNSQCQLWFGPTALNGNAKCYSFLNAGIAWYGHCGYNATSSTTYRKCQLAGDRLCGLLHCDFDYKSTTQLQHFKFAWASQAMASSYRCAVAQFNSFYSGSYLDDPGLVPDGAVCGTNMMCLNQKCVSLSALNVVACPNCNGHGVCNNLGQCHCDVGYAPPTCSSPGNGGSISSNPIRA